MFLHLDHYLVKQQLHSVLLCNELNVKTYLYHMLLHMEGMQLYQLAGSHWCLVNKCKIVNMKGGFPGSDRMVVGLTPPCAIIAYRH
jgi:hypothetical protein